LLLRLFPKIRQIVSSLKEFSDPRARWQLERNKKSSIKGKNAGK
jgi:hypothetical protein